MRFVESTLILALATTGVAVAAPETSPSPRLARKISIEFRGPLKDVLKKIAAEGGVNLVAIGDLNEQAEVYLKGVTAEEALQTVAGAYHLKIDRSGSIWTLRPMTETERSAQPSTPPSPPEPAPSQEPSAALPQPPTPEAKAPDTPLDRAANDMAAEISKSMPQGAPPLSGKELRQKLKAYERKYRHRKFGKSGSGDRVGRGMVVVNAGETVNNAAATGGSVTVNGQTQGDAVALGGSVVINGHVAGSAVAIGGSLHLGSNAVVEGDAVAIGGEITKAEGAEIGGDQVSTSNVASLLGQDWMGQMMRGGHSSDRESRDGDSGSESSLHRSRSSTWGFTLFLAWFAALFAVGFLSMVFAPTRMRQIEGELRSEPLKCGLAGLAGVLALIALTLILIVSIVGILLVPVLWFIVAVGIAMGVAAVANEIGMRVPFFRGRKTQALVLAVGILVLLVVKQVPYLGSMTILALTLVSLGAIIRTRFGQQPKGIPEPITP